jgi:hypothetical protein
MGVSVTKRTRAASPFFRVMLSRHPARVSKWSAKAKELSRVRMAAVMVIRFIALYRKPILTTKARRFVLQEFQL